MRNSLNVFWTLLALLLLLPHLTRASDATLTAPTPGTTFPSSTVLFTWTAGPGRYLLYVGTQGAGSNNLLNTGIINNGTNSRTVNNLPTDAIVYVRLWCETSDGSDRYSVEDYTYNGDIDADGILDTIDPTPGQADGMITRAGRDYILTILGSGRVASLESAPLFNSTFDDMSTAETRTITDKVYEQLEDDFDFIIICSNQGSVPSGSYFGRFYNAQNDIAGIGKNTFDSTALYGSAGKLQGAIHLTSTSGLPGGPSLHELAHNWANSMDSVPTAVGGHWGYSNVGGQLGGWQPNSLEDLGGGQYRARNPRSGNIGSWGGNANGGNGLAFSNFELYTMGLISAAEVGQDIKIANGFSWENTSTGVFNASSITTYTMTEVVSMDGARVPGPATSQKNFRLLYLIVTAHPLSLGEWSALDEDVHQFALAGDDGTSSFNFWEATGGRATLTMDGLLDRVIFDDFVVTEVTYTPGMAHVDVEGASGFTYTLQSSTNMTLWTDGETMVGNDSTIRFNRGIDALQTPLYLRVLQSN